MSVGTHNARLEKVEAVTAPHVLVMTPSRGQCAMGYHKSILAVVNERHPNIEIDTDHNWPEDVCVVRARMVQYARMHRYTRVFFWDSDVSMSVAMFLAIALSPYDFAAGLYVNAGGKIPFLGEPRKVANWMQVTHVPMGAACLSVRLLETLSENENHFLDVMPGTGEEIHTPDLFAKLQDARGHSLSEDYSFCERAVKAGYPPHVYTGDTATHWKMVPLKA